jgi:hypothetical protein
MLSFSKRRSIRHLTPHYIINRLSLMTYERNNPNSPWLTLKSGGILIIDNINWYWPQEQKSYFPNSRRMSDGFASPVWQQCAKLVKDWRYVWTSNGITDTAFRVP